MFAKILSDVVMIYFYCKFTTHKICKLFCLMLNFLATKKKLQSEKVTFCINIFTQVQVH